MAPVSIQERGAKLRKKYQKLGLKSTIIHRSITTTENKKLWYAFPNLDLARAVSLSRKFLHFNYTFTTGGKYAPKNRVKYSWTEWYSNLDKLRKQSYFNQLPQRKLMGSAYRAGSRVDGNILKRNIMTYGIPEDRATAAASYVKTAGKPEVERFLCQIMNDKGILKDTRLNVWPCINSTDVLSTGISSISTSDPTQNDDDDRNTDPEQRSEKWQMENWLKPLQKEYFTVEMNEIWYNRRLLGKRTDPMTYKQKLTPPVTEILIEILRQAYFHQEWFKVAKCIEGLCKEASTPSYYALGHSRHWIFWNAGFYSILRFESTLDGASTAIQNFARNFHAIFAPRTYPRRLGVEVAIWLTQEGRFLEGLNFMEEMNVLGLNPSGMPRNMERKETRMDTNNPKRALIDFLFHLIRAVHSYALYTCDNSLLERGLFMGNETDLRLRAEVALSAFESLLEYATKCDGEITTFLDQLVQLTIKCRSVEKAKLLFDQVVVKWYGNAWVEGAYLKFLSEHFPQQKNDICENLQIKSKFRFATNPPHWLHQGRAVAAYRKRQLDKRDNVKMSFKRVANPGFSW